jgi:tetratricopeptide (TPR) repeat protein
MKRLVIFITFFFIFFPLNSQAISSETIKSLEAKLVGWDIEEAWAEMKGHLLQEPKNPQLLELASHIAFHKGEYQEAQRLIRSAIEAGGDEEKRKGFSLFVEETIGVITPLKKYESSHFIISLDEKQDGFLVDYLKEALENTYEVMARTYGFQPKEKIRVEIFPNARAFYYASSLQARDIEIGAVGLTKFNKLMILSPGALVHGYRWLDAISHEYIHYLIVRMTANKAPIWFHEGLAKYEETRWREGPSYLSLPYQSLLSRALAEKRLIPFDKMEPSVVRLETPEEVQLAYAQGASAIEFMIGKADHKGLQQMMNHMATQSRRGATESIREILGLTFFEFERGWKEFLASKELKEMGGTNVRRHKIKEGKADEERIDMEEIKSLVARNRAHLADLLRERGRMAAAVLEYRRALSEVPDSISIINKLSSALIQTHKDEEALPLLNRASEISPDHPTTYTNMGKIHLKLKDFKKAREAFLESIQINPFNPEVHQGLAEAYEKLGEQSLAAREKEIFNQLKK